MKRVGLATVVACSFALAASANAFAKASPRTVASGVAEHWQAGETIHVVLDGSLSDIDPAGQDAVVAAFGTWMTSGASVNQVVVDRSTARGAIAQDGVNRILFGPIHISGHEKDVAVTISYADADTGVIEEADTIFNSVYPYGVMAASDDNDDNAHCEKRYDTQNVATHEFGHFFGLGEDTSETNTTMFIRSAPCQTHKRELTQSDRTAMAALYSTGDGATASKVTTSSPSSCAVSSGAPRRDTSAAFFVFAAVLAFVIRRGNGTRTCREPFACNRSS